MNNFLNPLIIQSDNNKNIIDRSDFNLSQPFYLENPKYSDNSINQSTTVINFNHR